MRHRLLLFHIITVFFICGCSRQKPAEPIEVLRHRTIDLGDQYLGVGGFLAYCQGAVVGIELNRSVQQPFFCLDPGEASNTFFFFGNKGQGPNEFLLPYSIQYIDGRTVGVLDAQTRIYSEFTVPEQGETLTIEKVVNIQSPSTRIIKTAFDQYISLLSLDEKMFSLVDSAGVPINTFFEYPYRDAAERKDKSRDMAYQGTLAANPSKTKFVYSSFFGEIIHFYAIQENNFEVIAKIENVYPLYRENNDGTRGVSYNAKGIDGYIATYATDNFVYAVYSGNTILERQEKKSSNFEGNILRVFDWTGVLVREYELDVPCSYLCVSDDDSTMWAIATLPEQIALVSFHFGNQAEERRDVKAEVQFPATSRAPDGPTGIMFSVDVRTKDNQQNEETRKVADSIRNLPSHIELDLRSNDRYEARIDSIDEYRRRIVLILK